ncbi:hypothetical protein GCT13_25015 [Paraburkholderia sp. CNPSo 3157]|uniref:Fatty acid desaturase domain-containing protein n=1 Tax=Paraburkholderia franconis TaxID=2654983 RepID=A0A7X1NEM8_9BURK|nr:fatty acid desaturase [Paraburkholderia franconis]MPW20063.1 hypothetical protein [Paraburkholderia franconis]
MTSWRKNQAWFWLSALMPMLAMVSFLFERPWFFFLALIVTILIGDPLLGRDVEASKKQYVQSFTGAAVPTVFIFLWSIAVLVALARALQSRPLQLVGLTLASGVLSAFAMAHVHEVMHRRDNLSRVVSDLALALAGYPHYRVVHQLHHAHVGEPRYGSTAPVGMSLWRHVGRSFSGALVEAATHEIRHLRHDRKCRILWPCLASMTMLILASLFGGRCGALFYIGQCAVSVFIVEAIGYIQHYGLCVDGAGGGQIAWDVVSWLSSRLFANNGRHTHHHLEQTQSYDQLACIGEPLPAGYLHMFLLAVIPPLWFFIMDRRLSDETHTTKTKIRQG